MRAVSRVCEVFVGAHDQVGIPSASGVRWWLLRLGFFALHEPLDVADDWAFLIDHSVQIGTLKLCLILGVRLSAWRDSAGPLRHEDVRPLALIPVEQSNAQIVCEQLEQAALRTGIPREIVSDQGGDVKSGGELFAARHPQTALLHDAAHHGARVLKKRFEADPRWTEFLAKLSHTKSHIQQTPDAFLMSPSLRPKARYMNLASLLKWCRKMLCLLDRGADGGAVTARARARYGWLIQFRRAIGEWSRWEATVRHSVEFLRTHGLSRDCEHDLAERLQKRPSAERHQQLEAELAAFAKHQSRSAQPGERLIGSTEVEESVFGKWKHLERQESSSGITSLALSLGALLGHWTEARVQTALEQTPVKKVLSWIKQHLPPSIQSQRRHAFAAANP